MPYYFIFWNFTEQGIKSLGDCLHSIDIFKGYVEARNGAEAYHGTFYSLGQGQYDAVSLVSEQDDFGVRYDLYQAEQKGFVRSTTLRCVTHEEASKFAEQFSTET